MLDDGEASLSSACAALGEDDRAGAKAREAATAVRHNMSLREETDALSISPSVAEAQRASGPVRGVVAEVAVAVHCEEVMLVGENADAALRELRNKTKRPGILMMMLGACWEYIVLLLVAMCFVARLWLFTKEVPSNTN